MGQKAKGRMWCDTCQRPIMAVKNTHRLRNTLSVGGSFATGGASLLGSKVEGYFCPTCGSRARAKRAGDGRATPGAGAQAASGRTVLALFGSVALWLVVALLLVVVTTCFLPYHLVRWRRRPPAPERAVRAAYRKVGAWVRAANTRFDTETGRVATEPLPEEEGPPDGRG